MIKDILEKEVKKALKKLSVEAENVNFEHPVDLLNGDYSTNIAMVSSKKPMDLAKDLVSELSKDLPKEVEKVEAVEPGFINFYLSKNFFVESLNKAKEKNFGRNESLKGEKIILEYTDPNPFKPFHTGHAMTNTIGESLARLAEYTGAEVKRANYQGDTGLHVAKAIWGLKKEKLNSSDIYDLGKAYSVGTKEYENNKEEIDEINLKIIDKSDEEVNEIYEKGREASLKYFEEQYKKLGTKFDYYFFESEGGNFGKEIVTKNSNLFHKSDGAIVFKGENYGLHTRVFVNSAGLPTYEAKELGLAKLKYDKFPYDLSYIITGNEIDAYFQVLLEVMKHVYEKEEFSKKTTHIGHGMLRLPEGKMSSRTGEVILFETLMEDIEKKVLEVMEDREVENKEEIAEMVAVGALKYSILKQGIGKDIIFNMDSSVSFEGDSGPYLQYTYVRAKSVLDIAKNKGLKASSELPENWKTTEVERLVYRFPEISERAWQEKAPQHIAKFLVDLAGSFNNFYANEKIAEEGGEYKLLLTEAVGNTLKDGLYLLGIEVPEKM